MEKHNLNKQTKKVKEKNKTRNKTRQDRREFAKRKERKNTIDVIGR